MEGVMKSKKGIGIGCSIFSILALISITAKVITGISRAGDQSEYVAPKVLLSCISCTGGIPIYDSLSITRGINSYGKNGEECEVSTRLTTEDMIKNQPNAQYIYFDTEPYLYLYCPSGDGYAYTSQTTYNQGR
jgi:hypothetical protein